MSDYGPMTGEEWRRAWASVPDASEEVLRLFADRRRREMEEELAEFDRKWGREGRGISEKG